MQTAAKCIYQLSTVAVGIAFSFLYLERLLPVPPIPASISGVMAMTISKHSLHDAYPWLAVESGACNAVTRRLLLLFG